MNDNSKTPEVTSCDISQIFPYEKNAKKHPQKQIDQVARSIEKFGFVQPIVVDKDGSIVIGHCRFAAAQKLEIKEVPIIRVENLSEDEVAALRIADNKLNESDWEFQNLNEELKQLVDNGFDITITGFGMDQIAEPDEKDDEAPKIPRETDTKLGDMFLLGSHRILCGDSTKIADVKRVMDGELADMIFTDPPYNVNYSGGGENTSNTIENDNMDKEKFQAFISAAIKNCAEVSKTESGWYVFHAHKSQNEFEHAIESAGWHVKNQIIWNKPSANLGWGDYMWKHEPIFYCGKEKTKFYGDRCHTTVLNIPEDDANALRWLRKQRELEVKGYSTVWSMKRDKVNEYNHPTQKPVELITYAIFNSSKEQDLLFEPFAGSGSTIIAAEKTNRICYAIELDPKYIDVIVKRWEEYTEQKAIKI